MSTSVAGIIAAIALALVAWFLGGRRKSDADTMEKITGAAADMIEQLRQELQRLTLQIDNVRMENTRLHNEVATLRTVVAQLEQRLAAVGDDGR